MRLFVALPVPPAVRAALEAAVAPARQSPSGAGVRWVRPDAWHLTLVFLGTVTARQLEDVSVRLQRAAARTPPLDLRIEGAGRFGKQVVWAAVTGDVERLRRLADSASAAARRAGIPVEARAFRAHLTLGRSDGSADVRALAEELRDPLRGLSDAAWTAEELQLVQSQLGQGPGGSARYVAVGRWPLAADRTSTLPGAPGGRLPLPAPDRGAERTPPRAEGVP